MELIAAFREAIVNLLSAKLRSFLAILGVLVGTGSVVALISSSQLATAHALSQFKTLGTNLLSLYLREDSFGGSQSSGQTQYFAMDDVQKLKQASPEIMLVAPYTVGFSPMYLHGKNLNGQIVGTTENFASIAKLNVVQGRFISYLDERNYYCVIGASIAKAIKDTGEEPLFNQLRVGHDYFTIVGVLGQWPENFFISVDINNSIIIPIKASYLLSKNTHIQNILIRLIENPHITSVSTQITNAMSEFLPKTKVVFNSPKQLIDLIAKQRQTYTMLLIAIGSISLVVGGIGVMNIMLVSVIERRREIGIRTAIGARQSDILRMFLIESIVLTIFGGFLGVFFGILTSYVLALFSGWQFYFYGTPIVLGFGVSVLVGILSGFYPAWRASKLDPIETLTSA